ALAHHHDVAHAQRALQYEQEVAFGHWTSGRETDGALHARIDRVAGLQDVAEDDLGDGLHRRVFEIELEALAIRGRLNGPRRRARDRTLVGDGAAALGRPGRGRAGLLGKARQQVDGANLVEHVGRALAVLAGDGVTGRDRDG